MNEKKTFEEELVTELNYNDEGVSEPTFHIDVMIQFDKHLLRSRLTVTESDLNIEMIGPDIKRIMHQLKVKQKEMLQEESELK